MRVLWACFLLAASTVTAVAQAPSFTTRLAEIDASREARAAARAADLADALRVDALAAGDRITAAQAARRLGNIRLEQDRFEEARSALTEAIAGFRETGQRRFEREAELLLARTLAYEGDRVAASRLATEAIAALEQMELPREALMAAYSQGLFVVASPPLQDALMSRALALITPDDRSPVACSLLQSHGDRRFVVAEYVAAHEALTRALACYESNGMRSAAGRVLVSLGRVQRAHGQLHAALDNYVRAAAMQQAEGDISAWLQSLNAQAVTHDRLGQSRKAEALLRQALAVAREQRLPRHEVFLQGNLAGSLLAAGRSRDALAELAAVAEKETTPETREIRYRQMAIAYTDLGRLDEALTYLERARAVAAAPSFDAQVGWLNQHATVLARQGRLDEAQRDLDQAIRRIEEARGQVLTGDRPRSGFGDLHQATFAASIDVAMRKGDTHAALDLAEQARARALLDLLQDRDATTAGEPPRVAGMQDLARALDTTLLIYWVDKAATVAWIVTPTSVTARRLEVSEGRLRDLVRQAGGAGDVAGAINASLLGGPDLRPWQTLHRALVTPLESALPTRLGARLTIVPHGPLLHLPFAGLRDARGRYMVERFTIHYAPSLAVLQATARRGVPPAPVRALVLGDPTPLPRLAGVQLPPPLPHAREEARRVARRLPTPAVLTIGSAATERAFRTRLAEHKWLHVATHARVAEEATASSYLLLARGSGTSEDDGLLTSEEVKGLPLDGATVVLSACSTALGRVTGEGTLGFTRSFLAAGARAVVATTWEMPDTAGLQVMEAFYVARAAGAGVSEALRRAQLQQLRALRAGRVTIAAGGRRVALPPSPLLWAGYIAVGHP